MRRNWVNVVPFSNTPVFMTYNTYRSLPLEGLYELLIISVRDMIAAHETAQDNLIAYKALKKQVEMLLDLIDEKRKELAKPPVV